MSDGEPDIQTGLPQVGLADLQRMIGAVRSADPMPVDYMVLDPAVPSGTHTEGRDGLGKKYVRVPAGALDGAWLPGATPTGSGRALGALYGINVYRREDLPSGWPDLLPVPNGGSGYARKPIAAADLEPDAEAPPTRGGPWYDQLARAVLERSAPTSAFRDYRELLDGSGIDPYREPMFDRVWCSSPGRRDPTTTFGLEFAGTTTEGELHRDAGEGAGGWPAVRRMLLEDMADRLFDAAAKKRNPYHDFVAFAERFTREQNAFTAAATGAFDALTDWQRRFAEGVERGDVDVTIAAGRRERKAWTAEVLKAFERRGTGPASS